MQFKTKLGLVDIPNAEVLRAADTIRGLAGYICTGCGHQQPANHFWYVAANAETQEVVKPLCAPCVRGGYARVIGKPWRHQGPFSQPVN
jgi:hypothetical protein